MSSKLVIRSIVPNTSKAYVLRVGPDWIQRLSIVAWRIEVFSFFDDVGRDLHRESTYTYPITTELDQSDATGSMECVVDGNNVDVFERIFDTEDEAIIYCRERLAKP